MRDASTTKEASERGYRSFSLFLHPFILGVMNQGHSSRYYVADLDAPSTTNLLTPSTQPSVQAALVRGPKMFRSTLSSSSLVGFFSFSLSVFSVASHLI
jgi:hypothetical protein